MYKSIGIYCVPKQDVAVKSVWDLMVNVIDYDESKGYSSVMKNDAVEIKYALPHECHMPKMAAEFGAARKALEILCANVCITIVCA